MSIRNLFKRKMPATFNAAEYETERILDRLEQCGGQADETIRLLEDFRGKIDWQSDALEAFRGKINYCAGQSGEIVRLVEDFRGKIDWQSDALEAFQGKIGYCAGQSGETVRLLEELRGKMDWQSDALEAIRGEISRQSDALGAFQGKIDHCAGQSDETARLLKSALERLDSLSERLAQLEGNLHGRADRLERIGICHTPLPVLSFEVALAEHCNLKCAGCDHFSPIAEPEFADIEEFTRDFERLSELFSGSAREIHLLGGEPLLHPDIVSFLQTARRCFPQAVIDITTNGLLLTRMGEVFWDTCHKEKIVVRPTKYPEEGIDYEAAEKLAAQYGVEYRYFEDTGQRVKTMIKFPLDLKGIQDPRRSFMLCYRANKCIYLQHGRLFTCSVAPTIHHLNRHFGTRFEEDSKDSIDIYQAESAEEILEYLSHPIPFCRYCMPERAQEGQPWRHSRKELSEWI